jgi:hypothetical protein
MPRAISRRSPRISFPTEFRGRRSTKVTWAGSWWAESRSLDQAMSS